MALAEDDDDVDEDDDDLGEGSLELDGDIVPAYLQIIQGMPWDWLVDEDIIYQPLNPLPEIGRLARKHGKKLLVDGVSALFVEPMDRHDGKNLLDRPDIGQRLKDREVAKVHIQELLIEFFHIARDILELCSHMANFCDEMTVDSLCISPFNKTDIALVKALQDILA